MEITIFILLIVFVFMVVFLWNQNKNRSMYKKRLETLWHKESDREYSSEDLEYISHFYRNNNNGDLHHIDDITWNDFNMDSLYAFINKSLSSIGDEYLYALLRTPVYDETELLNRDRLIEFFQNNPIERTDIQMIFKGIGRCSSVSDNIADLDELKLGNNRIHVFFATLLIISLLIIPFNTLVGTVLLIVVLINNILQYAIRKSKIELFFISLKNIMYTLNGAEKIENLKMHELDKYIALIKRKREPFAKFSKLFFLLSHPSANELNPLEFLLGILRTCLHIDLILFNSMVKAIQLNMEPLREMIGTLGEIESCISIASFRERLPFYSKPSLLQEGKLFISGDSIYHPLIKGAVSNSIYAEKSILVTGSNASGKSTFLRTIGINAILSQTLFTSPSKNYKSVYLKIYSSMAITDNLFLNESYYIAEIKSIKRILDSIEDKDSHTLCIIDEVLRGTNTIERIAASTHILKKISSEKNLCIAATHDIELTRTLDEYYDNYYFSENIIDNDILFDYKIKKGISNTHNAIQLLKYIGYEIDITDGAEKTVKEFKKTGRWIIN